MTDSNRSTEAVNISRDPYGLSKLRRAFEESQHRTGMVVGLPKVTIDASHVNHALVYIGALREEIQHLRSSAGACGCGEPTTLGVVHRADGPCFHYVDSPGEPGGQPPKAYRLQDRFDPTRYVEYNPGMWDLILIPQPPTKAGES